MHLYLRFAQKNLSFDIEKIITVDTFFMHSKWSFYTYVFQINTEPKISRVVHLVVTDEESLTQPVLPGQPMQVAGSTLALLDAPALAMQVD